MDDDDPPRPSEFKALFPADKVAVAAGQTLPPAESVIPTPRGSITSSSKEAMHVSRVHERGGAPNAPDGSRSTDRVPGERVGIRVKGYCLFGLLQVLASSYVLE